MKLPHRRQFLHLAAGATALPAVSRIAMAQAYPLTHGEARSRRRMGQKETAVTANDGLDEEGDRARFSWAQIGG
jgi:hypothetical protein